MSKQVTLGELVGVLSRLPGGARADLGIRSPHSYRGSYIYVAFQPEEDVSVDDMLGDARNAIGSTYTGWKGGEFTMSVETPVYIASWGNTGWPLTRRLLKTMLKGVAE